MHQLNLAASRFQRGATLMIALMILILVTMLGIGALLRSGTQFKLAGNLQFGNAARDAAESTLTVGEQWLIANYSDARFDTRNAATGPQIYGESANIDPLIMTWDDTNSATVSGLPTQRYLLQRIARNKLLPGQTVIPGVTCVTGDYPVSLFRVTTRGESARGAVKILQTVYAVQDKTSGGACTT